MSHFRRWALWFAFLLPFALLGRCASEAWGAAPSGYCLTVWPAGQEMGPVKCSALAEPGAHVVSFCVRKKGEDGAWLGSLVVVGSCDETCRTRLLEMAGPFREVPCSVPQS